MRVLLFVVHVCMLRECDGNAGVVDGGGVTVVSAGHVDGTRGSCNVSSVADVLGMSVVREIRGVGGVCEMCMCLARVGAGGEGAGELMRGYGLGFTNPVGIGGVLDVCLCCGGVGGLEQISQFQICLCVVVGPGFVSTSPALMRISASYPAGPHGRLATKKR